MQYNRWVYYFRVVVREDESKLARKLLEPERATARPGDVTLL